MALPLLRHCEQSLQPTDRLIVVARSPITADLLRDFSWKPNVEIWSSRPGFISKKLWPAFLLVKLRKCQPTLILAPMLVDRLCNAIWLALTGAQQAIVPIGRWLGRFRRSIAVQVRPKTHKVDECLAFAASAGLGTPSSSNLAQFLSTLHPETVQRSFIRLPLDRQWVAIAPGSGVAESHKRYPPPNFQDVIALLFAALPSVGVVLLGSNEERELLHTIAQAAHPDSDRCILFPGLPFAHTLRLLTQTRCLVTACSGASHLGALANIPIVGLYGPTNPGYTGAYSKHLHVVRLGLQCSPCYRNNLLSGCGTPVCMSRIPPTTVVQTVLQCLNGAPAPPTPWCETTNAFRPIYSIACKDFTSGQPSAHSMPTTCEESFITCRAP